MQSVQGPFRWDGDLKAAKVAGLNVAIAVGDVDIVDGGNDAGLVRQFPDGDAATLQSHVDQLLERWGLGTV